MGRRYQRGIGLLREGGVLDDDSPLGRSLEGGIDTFKKVYLGLMGALVVTAIYRVVTRDVMGSETVEELPYSDVVVDNAMERTRANEVLNYTYGGAPVPKTTDYLRLITGTPPYIPLPEDLL